ncbi:MAG TPA: heterodisulfide reductase [Rhodocyclaceae bacterium]|nr:MAG: heterodisulfide reductase [Betaproteobacteria bacterium CG2_30_68_42]PIV71821.1 MAG: heterodisulfide reductase [Rhodocyclales bacterium CG17_big_fil_post_rev_8_21_14_2_50_68_7]PIX75140.1 MAG: heterodisulfide reductase [Rhodocyclales bacterium CG_4_10_14_3_um_filter_68_10]PJA58159.1 MAG: heterodisulfide reductase [Rhodocyclales bacterium CG_4_9_14_3_um_filter_68_10]HCX34512.1 heterodisulfide reductase [Rhodocyclaceae bacterium]
MSAQVPERYRNDFLREVEERVEEGRWVKMCMQCGVCAGSCPFGPHWEHSPQKIFMMIRAGKRAEVLGSDSMWMCTSCYNCIVRCPRKLPITHIMHGLANYAHRLGLAPKGQPTREFARLFWDNCIKQGRANELKLTLGLYFKDGLAAGIKTALAMKGIGLGMFKAKRINPMELFGGHRIKDVKGLHAIIAKAREIEDRRKGYTS